MRFLLVDENTQEEYSFTVDITDDRFWDLPEAEDRSFNNLAEDIENNYGVLDGSSGDDELNGEWIGYFAYQTLPEHFPIALQRFRDWFDNHGYVTKDRV